MAAAEAVRLPRNTHRNTTVHAMYEAAEMFEGKQVKQVKERGRVRVFEILLSDSYKTCLLDRVRNLSIGIHICLYRKRACPSHLHPFSSFYSSPYNKSFLSVSQPASQPTSQSTQPARLEAHSPKENTDACAPVSLNLLCTVLPSTLPIPSLPLPPIPNG